MLLIKTRRDASGPLQAVSGIVERRHTLPILSNVLLEKGDSC
jgi:DNA polymerase-3 subunit beta